MSAPVQLDIDSAAIEAHLAGQERRRRRMDQETRRSNVAVPWSRKAKARDNRAAAKASIRREYLR